MARRPPDRNPMHENMPEVDWRKVLTQALLGGVVLIVLLGAYTSFYTVQPEGQAVVKRFGKVVAISDPGLHFRFPYGIDRQYFVPTARVLKHEFGFRTEDTRGRSAYRKTEDDRSESLMLTGDLKVIDVEWVVQYRVVDPNKYLHQVFDPDKTLRDISEAVMRQIVGNSLGSDVLTEKRVQVAMMARDQLQEILDSFESGIQIGTVELQDVTPPDPVKPAFNEVNQAEQERERFINEAEKRRNQAIPQARGEARKMLESAQGYAAQRTNRATGEVARFSAILEEYRESPEITRQRLYLEMIDELLPQLGRVFVVEQGQMSPIPLLNLDDRASVLGRGERQ
jgi:modulator of FtsH protease HflK